LARRESRAVAQRDQVAGALVEPADRVGERHALDRLEADVLRGGRLVFLVQRLRPDARDELIVHAPARDAQQPGERAAACVVEARAVSQRPLEHLARDVLGLGAVPQAVGDVGVHAPDQRLGICERIHAHQWLPPIPERGYRATTSSSACARSAPVEASARSYQSCQSPRSIEIALRKLSRASGTRPAASWPRPSASHGAGDQGMIQWARFASVTAAVRFPFSRAVSLRLSAALPTSPMSANTAAAMAPPTRPKRTVVDADAGLAAARPLSRIATPQRSPTRVTAGSSQSQSTPVWMR